MARLKVGAGRRGVLVRACVTAFALAGVLVGCGERNTYRAPPPPKVTVAPPTQRPVTYYLEATGNSAAVNTTNLVARVAGFVESIDYQDGDLVKKGKVLFTIEPETYELKLQQSKAAEASSRATLKQAQTDFDRQAELAKTGSGTRVSLDNATTTRENSQANLQQAEINTRLAAMNVDYAHVVAPFDGIVTARKISVGEYVGANSSPTVLATIVQSDPIYVNFNISEQDVLKIREEIRRRGLTQADLKKVPVEIGLQNEEGYPHQGTLNYASPTVDSTTGTLSARAILDNPNRVILPGMFTRVRIPLGTRNDALLVPDTALGTDQRGRYVFVIGKDNVVEQRQVETGPLEGSLRVIEKGLKPDDKVIVSGILRAIPGQKVDPQSAS